MFHRDVLLNVNYRLEEPASREHRVDVEWTRCTIER